jgi:hypothetical protein
VASVWKILWNNFSKWSLINIKIYLGMFVAYSYFRKLGEKPLVATTSAKIEMYCPLVSSKLLLFRIYYYAFPESF